MYRKGFPTLAYEKPWWVRTLQGILVTSPGARAGVTTLTRDGLLHQLHQSWLLPGHVSAPSSYQTQAKFLLINLVFDYLFFREHTARIPAAHKRYLCALWQFIILILRPSSLSCLNALQYLLTFKQPLIHSFFPIYAPGWSHVSLNHSCSCSSQGPGTLFSRIHMSRRVPGSVLFTPKHLQSHACSAAKKHTTP